MPEVIRVGMGEYAIAHAPGEVVTLGLGSCVGLCMYDPVLKLGALAHVMLPDSKVAKDMANPAKFADTAVPFLLREMSKMGAEKDRLVVKIAGGAQMFSAAGSSRESVGPRNVAAVEQALARAGLSVSAKSVGGSSGKSIGLNLETGQLELRTLQIESTSL